eukprot:m51a1_g5423 hypothetical protein (126) ;mRNA; f:138451-138828
MLAVALPLLCLLLPYSRRRLARGRSATRAGSSAPTTRACPRPVCSTIFLASAVVLQLAIRRVVLNATARVRAPTRTFATAFRAPVGLVCTDRAAHAEFSSRGSSQILGREAFGDDHGAGRTLHAT